MAEAAGAMAATGLRAQHCATVLGGGPHDAARDTSPPPAAPGFDVTREALPFEDAVSMIGLTGRFVGDDPKCPSHLRLRIADRAIIWPLDQDHDDLIGEIRRAVADMVANTALLSRTGQGFSAWADAVGLDPRLARTEAAFEMAMLLDSFAERLLTRPVLDGLLGSTTWRTYLHETHPGGFIPMSVEGPAR
jgi:hypothetical protein